MSGLAVTLSAEALERIARRAAELVLEQLADRPASPDGWMDARAAAAYLGLSLNALHKLTARREIPFEQDGPKCKCWFRRSELDAWRAGGNAV